jgi:pyruvate/2-oxoacid:ferredoxin oxidoreductase alpha subunit/NAD-dependent dihydropyrimidine dehydrogenase PreA subunit
MASTKERPKPSLIPEYCKACSRCIDVCAQGCIHMGTEIHPQSGTASVEIDLERCTACGLCVAACPEPWGLQAILREGDLSSPEELFGPRPTTAPESKAIPDTVLPLPASEPLVIKGTYASAIGALLAGCRHFFGYPITPSTEGAELMAKLLPHLNGTFVQAVSEVATINMIYGCAGAGLRSMTFTSSPGFSLMLEGLSYMIGAELPGVIVNVMRGGPGLGNIAPEQADIKLVCRGLGHGNTHAIVLAPSTPQEMLDLTILAFDLTFRYRNPVIVLCDGYLGQMTGKVVLPRSLVKPGLPAWAVWGDAEHRGNLISSIQLSDVDLEAHNDVLRTKYRRISEAEQRADLFHCADAEVVLIACNTPARMAKGAVQELRNEGIRAGLFRPQTLWPFPIKALLPLLKQTQRLVVVEASFGQLEDELRLALSHAGVAQTFSIEHVQHAGGVLPQQREIVERVRTAEKVTKREVVA